jgi:hypothetical protein
VASVCATSVLVAALSAAAAGAQVRLIPQAGLYVPVTDLGTVGSGSSAVDVAKKESTLALGATLEFGSKKSLGFRINGIYGGSSNIPVTSIGCTSCEARSSVAALTGSIVLRPLPTIILVRPYLQAGGGIKVYNFDEDQAREQGVASNVGDQKKLAGHLGVGTDLNLGLARFVIDLSDYVSGFDLGSGSSTTHGDTQHDFFFTVGLSIGG